MGVMQVPRTTREIGLVLGAGGARGLAHIGALRALEEAAFEPVAISGSSIGGLIGAMIAAGHDADYIEKLATSRSRWKFPTPGRRGGLIDSHRLIEAFSKDLPENIEELRFPYAGVAVDIVQGEVVLLMHGPLRPALEAMVAIPGILSPIELQGRYLIDGGTMNALPVDVVRSLTQRPIVAIDVTPPVDRPLQFQDASPIWERIWHRLTLRRRPLGLDVSLKAFSLQQTLLNTQRLERHPPDLCIRPELDPELRLEDFLRMEEAIECGYRSARVALQAWSS
jgi:NTE family protein